MFSAVCILISGSENYSRPNAATNIKTFVLYLLFIVKYFSNILFIISIFILISNSEFLVYLYILNYFSVKLNFCVNILTKNKVFSKVQLFITNV